MLRIGVNTGEVVTGTGRAPRHRRRRQRRGPARAGARRRARSCSARRPCGSCAARSRSERSSTCQAKGKAEPLPAYRLVAVSADAPLRSHDAPFVGREREQRLLADAWDRAQAERDRVPLHGARHGGRRQVAAGRGVPGGARRRTRRQRPLSFLRRGDHVLARRRDPQAAARRPPGSRARRVRARRRRHPPRCSACSVKRSSRTRRRSWPGRSASCSKPSRRRRRSSSCSTTSSGPSRRFLDLVEHVADLSPRRPDPAPLPRPAGPARAPAGLGRRQAQRDDRAARAARPADECERADRRPAPRPARSTTRVADARSSRRADGNPLFVEEMLALIRERRDGGASRCRRRSRRSWQRASTSSTPPSAACSSGARWRGRSSTAAPSRRSPRTSPRSRPGSSALVRKELVRPDRTQLPGDDAYRFRHLLIRDAAYEALPKSTRAELHERFADWLEEHGADLVELDEILGYHLEQAHRYRARARPRGRACRTTCGARRARGSPRPADRAAERGDSPRARDPAQTGGRTRSGRDRRPRHCGSTSPKRCTRSGSRRAATLVAEQVRAGAVAAGDRGPSCSRGGCSRCSATGAAKRTRGPSSRRFAAEAIPLFERADDDEGLVAAWGAIADVEWLRCRQAECLAARRRALEHARRAGKTRHEWTLLSRIGASLFFGPTPAAEALLWFDEHRWLAPTRPGSRSLSRGRVLAFLGRFDEGRAAIAESEDRARELGIEQGWRFAAAIAEASSSCSPATWPRRSGRSGSASRSRERLGLLGVVATVFGVPGAGAARSRARDEAAWRRLVRSEKLGAERRRHHPGAVAAGARACPGTARRAPLGPPLAEKPSHAPSRRTCSWSRGDALSDLAEVLELGGDPDGAAAALERALAEYEQKGSSRPSSARKARLAALRAPA